MIALTIDTEWAPDHVLADTLELLAEYDVSATLFSTHQDSMKTTSHERALHPNFFKDKEESEIIDGLASHYPDAKGLRSHGMYTHTALRELYPKYGIEYESNYLEFRVSDLEPIWMPDGTLQFPVYWMDDQWLSLRGSSLPAISDLLSGDGLKVFDFHPPHICYNTPTHSYYESNKDAYWDDSTTTEQLRATESGVRDVFIKLLEHIRRESKETVTLKKLTIKHSERNPYEEWCSN